jgi:hypothetical protein
MGDAAEMVILELVAKTEKPKKKDAAKAKKETKGAEEAPKSAESAPKGESDAQ